MIRRKAKIQLSRRSLHWLHYLALSAGGLLVAFLILVLWYPSIPSATEVVDVKPIQVSNEHGILVPKVVLDSRVSLDVMIADEQQEKMTGLGFRDAIPEHVGMLFASFDNSYPVFWMKGMQFDLDIIWIHDNEIVDIDTNVSHLDQSALYRPIEESNLVLEVTAGLVEKYGITVGDKVEYHNIIFK